MAVDNLGRLQLADLQEALSLGRTVASIMWANNETGVVFPMARIAELVTAAGGILHTDAVQAVG